MSRREPTAGFALALVLICLTVVTLSLTAMISRVSQGRRQVMQRQRQVQAQWLADSAIDRAVARWQRDPAYRGETWQLASETLGNRGSAEVTIEVTPATADKAGTIGVTVIYPRDSSVGVRCQKQVPMAVRNPEHAEVETTEDAGAGRRSGGRVALGGWRSPPAPLGGRAA